MRLYKITPKHKYLFKLNIFMIPMNHINLIDSNDFDIYKILFFKLVSR